MEKKLENTDEIKFIKREQKLPIFEKLSRDISLFMIKSNYENGNLYFKILYDKIYRNSLFSYIYNSDINVPNKTRTFISFNKENFHYRTLKNNEDFLSIEEKNQNNDELFVENLYLLKTHKIYKNNLINKYSSFLFFMSLMSGLIFQKKSVLIISGIGLAANFAFYNHINADRSELQILQNTSFPNFQNKQIYKLYRTIYNQF